MQVVLGTYLIEVIIIHKNNKNIYFRFKDDLKLYVSASPFVSKKQLEKMILKNEEALLKMYEQKLLEEEASNYFYYLGEKYNIEFVDTNYVLFDEDKVFTKDMKMLDKFYIDQCKKIFESRVEKFKLVVEDLPLFNLKIRKMKTRWGVCNRGNNTITLNSELLKKEVTLIDYVIVHEMCHFHYADHSKNFWMDVEKYYPYYKQARKMLKDI